MTGEGEKYTCERCGGEFVKGWTDEEAATEYQQTHPVSTALEDEVAIVCDPCFREYMAWARSQGIRL